MAVSLTSESVMSVFQIPLAVAVASWGLSFFFGARGLYNRNIMVGMNAAALEVRRRGNVDAQANELFKTEIGRFNKKQSRFGRWQFYWLVAGAVSFVAWHVLEMWARTPATAA